MQSPPRSPVHWALLALAPACLVALAILGTLISPAPEGHGTHTQLGLPPCLPMVWWGVPCPGCGVTTSVSLAAHGRFLEAFLNQPFGALVALGLALYPLWALYQLARRRDLSERARALGRPLTYAALALAILGAWIYKLVGELS